MVNQEANQFFDAQGNPVADHAAQMEAIKAAAVGEATACFELHNGAMRASLDSYQRLFQHHAGTGGISFGRTVCIAGRHRGAVPDAVKLCRTYGFDGNRTAFPHTMLVKGLDPLLI
jgi:hypothetical protein